MQCIIEILMLARGPVFLCIQSSTLFFINFYPLVVPSHPVHVMFHGYMQSIHPIFSHSGFEKLYIADKERANMGTFSINFITDILR